MQTRLIMFEGVPFTGKSTQSEFVTQQLSLHGSEAQWVPEGVMLQQYFPHVLDVLNNTQTVSEDLLWADWNAFVQAVMAAEATFVVDAALSFAAVLPLLGADRPQPRILAELKRIADLCAPLQPRVIHLAGDAGRIARTSIVERGEGWEEHLLGQSDTSPYQQARGRSGVGGAISFLHDAQDLMRIVLVDGAWQALELDITATDWATNRRTMLEFLGLDEVLVERPDLAPALLQSYTGTYAADGQDESDILTVRLEQETLALYGPRMRYGALIPLSTTRFHVSATRIDIRFEVDEPLAQRLVLFTPDGAEEIYRRT